MKIYIYIWDLLKHLKRFSKKFQVRICMEVLCAQELHPLVTHDCDCDFKSMYRHVHTTVVLMHSCMS